MLPNPPIAECELVTRRDRREEMFGHMNATTSATACADTAALMDFADRNPAAKDGPAGCVGCRMSGALAFVAAAATSFRGAGSAATPIEWGRAFAARISRRPNDQWTEPL